MATKKATSVTKKPAIMKAATTKAEQMKTSTTEKKATIDTVDKESEKKTAIPKDAAPKTTPKATPDAAPKVTPEVAPKAAVKAAPKKPVKKTVKKDMKVKTVVEYYGKQVDEQEVIARVKKVWTKSGKRVGDIKTLELYIKPEEAAVYYVINQTETGAVEF